MNISIYIEPISAAKDLTCKLLEEEFDIQDTIAVLLYDKIIAPHFAQIKDGAFLLAETNYVDKVYRDSFYSYYSSKLPRYKRDCIRISIFDDEIKIDDFWNKDEHANLQGKYSGFLILRPTDPNLIGRSIISPKVLKINNFRSCISTFNTTANGVKFTVKGFPHSSQDRETISCAETSLWAIMEYFSTKYPEYQPTLPSKIIRTLNTVSSERQIPSKGLNIAQMSYALKEFGFGTKIYSNHQYGTLFFNLLSCYIESGIPVIVAMENRPIGNIGHALLAIGHDKITDLKIDSAAPIYKDTTKNITLYDFDSIEKDFIFIDDNHPAYQKASLTNPAVNYSAAEWNGCQVTYFIVPLYPKIYLEAYEVKNFLNNFLLQGPEPLNDNSEVLLRTYLVSSRSFKHEVSQNDTIQDELKSILLETCMPKFVWVSEVTTKDLLKERKANGIILIDATEANIFFNKPLIIAAYQDKIIMFDERAKSLEKNSITLHNYCMFEHNLY